MRPRQGNHMLLELQDRQEGVTPDRLDPEPRAGQHLAVLGLDPVVEGKLETSAQQDVDEPSRRAGRREESGHQDVGVQDPYGLVSHAALSGSRLCVRP